MRLIGVLLVLLSLFIAQICADEFDIDEFDVPNPTVETKDDASDVKDIFDVPSASPEAPSESVPEPAVSYRRTHWSEFGVEIGTATLIIIYSLVAFLGGQDNKKIAKDVAGWLYPILEQNFAKPINEDGKGDAHGLYKVGPNEYRIYSSGRINVKGMLTTISLRRRQDLLFRILSAVGPNFGLTSAANEPDFLHLEFPLEHAPYSESIDTFSMALVPPSEVSTFLSDAPDLAGSEKASVPVHHASLPHHLDLLAESQDMATLFFPGSNRDGTLAKKASPEVLRLLYLTVDSSASYFMTSNLAPRVLRVSLAIPKNCDRTIWEEEVVPWINACFAFVDKISKPCLSSTVRASLMAARKEVEKKLREEQEQERLAQERERQKQEELDRIAKMTDKQREAYFAKKEQMEMAKEKRKIKALYKKGYTTEEIMRRRAMGTL